jgi:hypothetical protein
MCQSFLVLFFKKEPLALPLAFGGGHLHTWAVTFLEKKQQKTFADLTWRFRIGSAERVKAFCVFFSKEKSLSQGCPTRHPSAE